MNKSLHTLRNYCCFTVSATTVVTLPTTTFPTTTPKICVFNKDVFVNNFGYEPAEVIGYVNKDNDDSVISESEKIRVGDSLDDGVIVVINGCSNWYGFFLIFISQNLSSLV